MKKLMLSVALAAVCAGPLSAKIEMGVPFTDHAVLQRGRPVPVWGTAGAGNEVTVSFAGRSVSAVAAADGAWRVDLPALDASGDGRTLTVVEEEPGWFGSRVDTVEIADVVVGEVWLASGQSNMECPIWGKNPRYRDGNGGLMTAASHLPNIRFAVVPRKWSVEPVETRAAWTRCVPSELAGGRLVSAVGFYYARELHLALGGVPVGIVSVNWGGTNIDAWTPRSGYEGCDPALKSFADYPVKHDWKREKDKKWTIGGAHQQPTVLWNGMVSAWAPMAARGFIWYQGCHNASESDIYCAKMQALYNGWAKEFENPSLKLYFVQLAPYSHNWMKLVAAQNRFAAAEKNAAIAVTADVGNFSDIHPNRKEIVAKRLAVHALKNDYGFDISETDSPVFKSAVFDGATAKLTFDNVRAWYVYAADRSVNPAFELAGADGVWHPARLQNVEKSGTVKGTTLELTSDKVARPVRARYLGRNRTMGTVYNEVSLPLGPFETP